MSFEVNSFIVILVELGVDLDSAGHQRHQVDTLGHLLELWKKGVSIG